MPPESQPYRNRASSDAGGGNRPPRQGPAHCVVDHRVLSGRQTTPPTVPRFQQTESFERGEGGAGDGYGGPKQHVEERLPLTLAHGRSAEKTDEVGGRGTRQAAQKSPPPCCPSVPRCCWSIQWRRLLVQLPPDHLTLRNQNSRSGQKGHDGDDKPLSDTTEKKEWAHPLNNGILRQKDRCQQARRDAYLCGTSVARQMGRCPSAIAGGVAMWPVGGGVERVDGTPRGRARRADRHPMHTGRAATVTGRTTIVGALTLAPRCQG